MHRRSSACAPVWPVEALGELLNKARPELLQYKELARNANNMLREKPQGGKAKAKAKVVS